MNSAKPIEKIPRGTLVAALTVAWGLLSMVFGFMMNDVWNRVHDAEINIAHIQSEHQGFDAGMKRLEKKLDTVLYQKLGMSFGEIGGDSGEGIYLIDPTNYEN